MKKTIAVIGSAAALSFAGAGLAAAQDADDQTQGADTTQTETTEDALDDALDEVETPAESPTSPRSCAAPSPPMTSSAPPRAWCPA